MEAEFVSMLAVISDNEPALGLRIGELILLVMWVDLTIGLGLDLFLDLSLEAI